MKIITHQIDTLYRYNNKFYRASSHKKLCGGDIIIDGRDYNFKRMECSQDIIEMSFVNPELYCVLEEVTIQN